MTALEGKHYNLITSFVSGGAAGFVVDITLFPLDTLKTRLQSNVGLKAAGGFQNLYSGIGPAALGSAPNAAAFFCTYEATKHILKGVNGSCDFCNHAAAASLGEVVACLIRVPTEVVKQRRQAFSNYSSFTIIRSCFQEGIFGLYRGYFSTVAREIPFSFIQYPLWEFFKRCWSYHQGSKVQSWQSALSGAFAGGIAATITTPLDVAKTRIMLAAAGSKDAEGSVLYSINTVYQNKGLRGLFAGVLPRSLWMSVGGAIYFGVYELVKNILTESNFGRPKEE